MLTTMTKREAKQDTDEFEPQWIHAQVTDQELWEHFEQMAKSHQGGKSAFVRWLIDQEWARRTAVPSHPNQTKESAAKPVAA